MSRPLRIAHRGGAGLWPENTIDAFERAIGLGVDGIELDVRLTRDGKLAVHHDAQINLDIARGRDGQWLKSPTPQIGDLTFEELQAFDVGRLRPGSAHAAKHPGQEPIDGARIPLLDDVYRLIRRSAKPDFFLYVELKTSIPDRDDSRTPEDLAEVAVEVTARMDMAQAVTFVSFDWRTLTRARELAPEIANAFTTMPFATLDPGERSAANDAPGSIPRQIRRASANRPPWFAGYNWQDQDGADFGERMLKAISAGPSDSWFAWHGDVTSKTAALAREHGLGICCWTVDDPAEIARLVALGVDGILSDHPDRLVDVLER